MAKSEVKEKDADALSVVSEDVEAAAAKAVAAEGEGYVLAGEIMKEPGEVNFGFERKSGSVAVLKVITH